MRLFILASIMLGFSTLPSEAQEKCLLENNFCVPVFGCIMDTGELVVGFSLGRFEGPVRAVFQGRALCSGTWKRTALGPGRVKFACQDGRSGKLTFTIFDKPTGKASGRGRLNSGESFRFWAGHNFAAFLERGSRTLRDFENCAQAFK